jgi:uncharacterized protein (DUF2235 family)
LGKKIILLSDGTGNSSAKVWRTNVWRVFESLDLSGSDQVAFYDDGVGTSSFKPAAILGGAFGFGLKRNVIDLYKFVCRNYRKKEDPEIYGFGFSRGAFTIRIVVGLMKDQGLVEADSEEDLDAKAKAAYQAFRKNFHTNWYYAVQWLGSLFTKPNHTKDHKKDATEEDKHPEINIRFLGLWDTVAAYGMPVEEMTLGISQWIWPWQMPDYRLNRNVQRACHALSIDDERTTFHPILWDERKEEPLSPRPKDGKRYLADERISQVWFAGTHSNVGGGYPDDSIAQIPLIWILSEAKHCGLRFKSMPDANPQTYGHPLTAQDKDGRIYDSRQGLGGYYRYGPRDIQEIGKDLLRRKHTKAHPEAALARIHASVLHRIENNAQSYAPKGLPAHYEVVTADGQVLAPGEPIPGQATHETIQQGKARSHIQEKTWNIIWLRRIVYFLTVGVSVYLVAFPALHPSPSTAELMNPLRWMSDVVRVVGAYLPAAAVPWTNAYARDPLGLIFISGILAGVLWFGGRLAEKIDNAMGIAWQKSLRSGLVDDGKPDDLIYKLRTSRAYTALHAGLKKYLAPAVFASFVYLGLSLTSHVAFNVLDDAGWVCQGTTVEFEEASKLHPLSVKVKDYHGLVNLDPGQTMLAAGKPADGPVADKNELIPFDPSDPCQSTRVWVEHNGKYVIKFDSTDSFKSGNLFPKDDANPAQEVKASEGFDSLDPPGILSKALMVAAVPLRRELTQPWFRIVAKIGPQGGEEQFLDPDFRDANLIDEEITATRDGELFLFVNDAVIGIPGFNGYFYKLFYDDWKKNSGKAYVKITRKKSE